LLPQRQKDFEMFLRKMNREASDLNHLAKLGMMANRMRSLTTGVLNRESSH